MKHKKIYYKATCSCLPFDWNVRKWKSMGSLCSPYNIDTSSSAFFCQQVSRQYWQLSDLILGVRRPELLHFPSQYTPTAKWSTTLNIQTSKSALLHKCPAFWLIYLNFTYEKVNNRFKSQFGYFLNKYKQHTDQEFW